MDEVKEGLKYVFQTKNAVTFCGTGSGNAGMEIVLGNLIEPKDVVLCCVSGAFGQVYIYIFSYISLVYFQYFTN